MERSCACRRFICESYQRSSGAVYPGGHRHDSRPYKFGRGVYLFSYELCQHLDIAAACVFKLYAALLGLQKGYLHRVEVGLVAHAVFDTRLDLPVTACQLLTVENILPQLGVGQQDAEVELIDAVVYLVERHFGVVLLHLGLGFDTLLAGTNGSAVPYRLRNLYRHAILVFAQHGNLHA